MARFPSGEHSPSCRDCARAVTYVDSWTWDRILRVRSRRQRQKPCSIDMPVLCFIPPCPANLKASIMMRATTELAQSPSEELGQQAGEFGAAFCNCPRSDQRFQSQCWSASAFKSTAVRIVWQHVAIWSHRWELERSASLATGRLRRHGTRLASRVLISRSGTRSNLP